MEDPDAAGHARGWGSSRYSNAVMTVDQQIGRVLDAIQSSPTYHHRTVVVVTADHGGGAPRTGHDVATNAVNFRVPLFVWGTGIPAGVDAYSLFANRADPGDVRVSYSDTSRPPPLRNGDTGNLAVSLLGLPPIPGSSLIPLFRPSPARVD